MNHFATDKKFKRLMFLVGVLLIFSLSAFGLRIHKDILLKRAEHGVEELLPSIVRFPAALNVKNIKIAGPDGDVLSLGQYEGRFILLNLWATWCVPCIKELPELEALRKYYATHDIIVMAVSIDSPEQIKRLVSFIEKYNPGEVALYHDFQEDLQRALPAGQLPTTFLIGPKGKVLYQMTGKAQWYDQKIINFLDEVRKVY